MSNVFQSTEWIIDTPSTTTILTTDPVYVQGLRWVGASTAAHAVAVTDQTGKVKWRSVGSGANYVESDLIHSRPTTTPWNGLMVPLLSSGSLFIEFL